MSLCTINLCIRAPKTWHGYALSPAREKTPSGNNYISCFPFTGTASLNKFEGIITTSIAIYMEASCEESNKSPSISVHMEGIGHVVKGCMKVRVKPPEAIQSFGVPQLLNYLEGWNLTDGVGETNESLNHDLQSSVYQQENHVDVSCNGAIETDPEYLTAW